MVPPPRHQPGGGFWIGHGRRLRTEDYCVKRMSDLADVSQELSHERAPRVQPGRIDAGGFQCDEE